MLEDLVLVVRRGEIGWVHSEGVYEIVPKQECKDAGMRLLDLIWVDTDKSVDPAHKKIRSRLCAREYKTKKQGKIQRALPTSQLFSAMPPLEAVSFTQLFSAMPPLEAVKVLVSIMIDVGELVEQRETIEVETLRHQQSTFPRNSPETQLHPTSRRRSSELWRRQSWQICQQHVWNSRCLPHLATGLCESDLWRVWRLSKGLTQCSIVSQSERRCQDVSARRRLLCVCQTQIQIHSKRHGNTWIRRFRREKPSVVESRVQSWDVSNWTVLGHEPDLRHAPLIISESGCNANTKTVSTPREKLQDKLVLDGRRSPILNREDATRYRSACMRLSNLAQDRLDLAETAKHLAQRMSEPRDFDFAH